MKRCWISIAMLLCACGGEPESDRGTGGAPAGDEARSAEAVATWQGGSLAFAEIEEKVPAARTPACLKARHNAGGGSLDELLPCYQDVAQGMALERLILAELEDVDRAIEELEIYPNLRRQALLEAHLRRSRQAIEITDAEAEAYYEANQERYRQPASLNLSNIFKRHDDPQEPEATVAFLNTLKERFLAGETFESLAREHSESETRLRGGEVGRVTEGQLPPALAKVAFSLGEGEVSDPIRVRGGAVLLYTRNVLEGLELSLGEVRRSIINELRNQRLEEEISERAAGREPPPGSTTLAPDDLVAALDGDDPELVVLEIGEMPLTAGQLRAVAGLGPAAAAADLDDDGRQRLTEVYQAQMNRRFLLHDLLEAEDPELLDEAQELARERGRAQLLDGRLRDQIWQLIDDDPEKLRRYWEDNRHHYQSSPRFKLWRWRLPLDADPPQQLRRMEELQRALVAGTLDLTAAAGELGGTVEDLGWREFNALGEELTQKAQTYLLEIGDSGFSVPYQDDEALHVLWLEQREEPRELSYEEAQERVRNDYFARFQKELYDRARDDLLSSHGFAFDQQAVRRLVAPEATTAAS